jgi:protein-tyrosine phosphatase
MISRILVVCIGNICRSPMAEGLLKRALPHVQTTSAGLGALVGQGADPTAVRVMADVGVDITAHRARMITDSIAREADLILVMDEQQKAQIAKQYPYARGRVFRLAESASKDIPDPYKQSPEMFNTVFELAQNGVNDWVKRINSIA